MTYRITKLPKSQIEIDVTLPPDEFKPHAEQAAVFISEEAVFEGFRKGKAPYHIVKDKVGEGKIYERAAEIAIRKTYPAALQNAVHDLKADKNDEEEIIPIGKPDIMVTKLAAGNPFEYKAKIALLPFVTLPDYKTISLCILPEKQMSETSDEEIQKAIQWIRESRAPVVTVDRPAKMWDLVEITFEIRHAGVKLSQNDSQNHPLVIGKNVFLPGFEEKLIGMKTGDQKNFTLSAPQDWREKSLAGRALDFTVTLKLVQEKQIPELNDEFVKSIGTFVSVDSFIKSVRDGILREKEEKERSRIRGKIIEDIEKNSVIDVPDALINAECDKMISDFKQNVIQMGMKWEDYLLHIKKTENNLMGEWRNEAEKRVRASLCLRKIAKKERIEPSLQEIEERTNQYLRQFETPEEARRAIDLEGLKEYSKSIIRNEKVFTLLETLKSPQL